MGPGASAGTARAVVTSLALPGVSSRTPGRPSTSTRAWILVVCPPRDGRWPASEPPFTTLRRAVRLDVCRIDCRGLAGPSGLSQCGQHCSPETTSGPAVEPIVGGGARPVVGRAVAPAASGGRTCRMPEIIRLSSLRSGPGWFCGMNGSITAHCASESQNPSAIIASEPPSTAPDHETAAPTMLWFGSGLRALPRGRASPVPQGREQSGGCLKPVHEHRCGVASGLS